MHLPSFNRRDEKHKQDREWAWSFAWSNDQNIPNSDSVHLFSFDNILCLLLLFKVSHDELDC